MTEFQLFEAIGRVKDEYLADCEKTAKHHRRGLGWAYAAAVVVVIIGIYLAFPGGDDQSPWPVKEIHVEENSGETAEIPHWQDLTVSQQYTAANIGGIEYSSCGTSITPEYIGGIIDVEAWAQGIDEYADKLYTTEIRVYQIAGISSDCAVAVEFYELGDTGRYAYVNPSYRPDTLGQFIQDLNLQENLNSGSAWYSYLKDNGEYATVEFVDLDDSVVWDMLLSDISAESVQNYDAMEFAEVMSVSVDIPLLGYKNISLAVTEEGYVTTNILDTGKAFFIGTDKIQAFVDYVLENCQGYEIVYVYGDEQPENGPLENGAFEEPVRYEIPE